MWPFSELPWPLTGRVEELALVREALHPEKGSVVIAGGAGGAWLALTDGRTATRRVIDAGVRDLVLFDLALDYSAATRLA